MKKLFVTLLVLTAIFALSAKGVEEAASPVTKAAMPEIGIVTNGADELPLQEDPVKASMTAIRPEDGFRLVNVPYAEGIKNHKNGESVGSHPFSSMYCSVGEIDNLAERLGYGEMEFFMSGNASIYGLAEDGVNVPTIKSHADYTTRLLIHYPKDAAKFSGRIYVDILNASAGYDLEDIFRRSYRHFMENGDIYIGITSKSSTAQALKNFDAERYASIDWLIDNDDPNSIENGLVWDMLSQLGTVLKHRPEDIFGDELGTKIKQTGHTYLVGQSQSGFYLQTYLMVFYPYLNDILGGRDIFDGYFNAVGATPMELSTGVSITNIGWPKTAEPYIVMMGQGESTFRLAMGYYPLLEDKDEQDWKFRLYEVAGAPHSDPTSPILPNNFEVAKANTKTDRKTGKILGTSNDMRMYAGNHVESDLQLDEFVTGALVNLDLWSRDGIPAPNADGHWLEADPEDAKKPAFDEWGNVLGGLRNPKIDAPLCTYYGFINNGGFATEGSMVHFTKEQLDRRYQGLTQDDKCKTYLDEFKASADKALEGRYITQKDYNALIVWSVKTSAFEQRDSEILEAQKGAVELEKQNASARKTLNSTLNSVGNRDPEWNNKAFVWTPAMQLNSDGTIQYVNRAGKEDKLSVKYVEKEYFVRGNANLYNIAPDNRLMIREGGLPYVNRIIVRTPANPEDFNGKVYADILNASDKYDNESLWRRAYGMIMEEKAAYVGITAKPVCIEALKLFDEHYKALSWASPNTYQGGNYKIDKARGQTVEEAYAQYWIKASELPYTDIGFVWDIVSQAGYAVQANQSDMFGKGNQVEGVYLYGQSQSGFVMNGYFRFMQFLKGKGEKLPYDGFMCVVGTYPANKINQSDPTGIAWNKSVREPNPFTRQMGTTFYMIGKGLGVPVIYVTTQNDKNPAFRPENGKNLEKENLFAIYEIAGAPHSDPAAPVFPYNDDLVAMGYNPRNLFPSGYDQGQIVSDYNSNMFVQALLLRLDKWASDSEATPPELAQPFVTVPKGKADCFPEGGLRSPQLDVPIAHYYCKPIGAFFSTSGTMVPFTPEELKQRYPEGFKQYESEFAAALEKLVSEGLIRPTDGGYMLKYCESKKPLFEAFETL